MRRRAPRPAALAVARMTEAWAPATGLAAVQAAWGDVVGEGVAAQAVPVAERDGVLTVRCRSAVWAQELTLMGPDVVAGLRDAVGPAAPRRLRCVVAAG